MTATFQFCARDDLGSEAIKTFEHGWCSHVDAIMPDGSLLGARSDEVGGQPAGVQIRPAAYLQFTKVVQYVVPFMPDQHAAFFQFLSNQLGKPYDKEAIVAFALGRDWREPDSWFCSELMTAAVEASGLWKNARLSEDVNFITPRDFELIISPWASSRCEFVPS